MGNLPKIIDATPEETEGKYNIEFLKEKGYFEEQTPDDPRLDNGTTVKYAFDSRNRIAYFEDVDIENISEVVKGLRKQKNLDYYWFWDTEEERLEVLRTFGENKRFIFNPEVHKRDTKRSKENKLSKIDNEISKLFDVKDVVNRFYKDLWNHRLKLAKSIEIEDQELSDQEKILAAQRLIDRLMFTYFLAEKGIVLGIAPNGNVGELNAKEMFKNLVEESDDFGELLETIFYDRFNSKTKNDYDLGDSNFSIYLPYLNGGMFRPEKIETKDGEEVSEEKIKIEGFDWRDLIEELNQYNWILEDFQVETTNNESVKGELTPEILGYIYEKFVITVSELEEGEVELDEMEVKSDSKLQTGNREIGAYYTPEDVVNYIVNENLWSFVQEEVEETQEFESFDDFYEEHQENEEILEKVEEALSDITVVDPGVGSGHFLLSTATQLEDWRKKCGHKGKEYELRKEMVLENLYGVDVMEGASDICQLRLWLYLVSAQNNAEDLEEVENLRQLEDESEVEPLPNIDYNIRTGNSLIGFATTDNKVVDGNTIYSTQGLEGKIDEYSEKVDEIKEKHSNVNEFKSELQELHESIGSELNKRYVNYLRAYFNSEGESRKIYFTDGEDFKKKISEFEEPKYVKIESKKSGLDRMDEELSELFPNSFKWVGKGEIDPENADLIAEKIEQHGADNLKYGYIEDQFRSKRLSEDGNYTPLHWILEFPEIFDGDKEGFDIVIGNPPYGSDVLSNNEKQFLQPYKTEGCGDICGYFLEREIDLTRTDGFVGNIIAGALAVNNSMTPVRDYMRETGDFEMSFIGKRPSQIFQGVEIRVSTVNGQITREENAIKTSKNIRFTSETRNELFENLEFESTDGLILGSKIGKRNNGEETRLPKIGNNKSREILQILKDSSKKRVLSELEEDSGDNNLQLRISAFYWVNALRDFPYNNTKIKDLSYSTELERDFSLILLNSSLFYFYWMVYGNNRDVGTGMVGKFPAPTEVELEEFEEEIKSLADRVEECVSGTWDPDAGANGEFSTGKCKSVLDEVDDLLGEIYGLDDSEVEFIKTYNSDIRLSDRVLKQ